MVAMPEAQEEAPSSSGSHVDGPGREKPGRKEHGARPHAASHHGDGSQPPKGSRERAL